MDSFSIVEAGNVFKNAFLGLLACCEFFQVHEFFLQHTVERFDTSIIVTVPFPAHTAVHLVGAQPCLVVVGSILAATVGVMQDLSAWSLLAVGSIECR
ncbi:hypothetical protein D3C72_1782530 [compost metagenome]